MILICPSSNMMNWTPLVSDPIKLLCILKMGLRSWHNGKESACWCKRRRFIPSLGWADPLKEEMATHSIILAWRISWTEETGRLQSTERVGAKSKTQLVGVAKEQNTTQWPKQQFPKYTSSYLCVFSRAVLSPCAARLSLVGLANLYSPFKCGLKCYLIWIASWIPQGRLRLLTYWSLGMVIPCPPSFTSVADLALFGSSKRQGE